MTRVKYVLLCLAYLNVVVAARAETQLIGVAAETGASPHVAYFHILGHGFKGHVITASTDQIEWVCVFKANCTLSISLKPGQTTFCSDTFPISGTGSPTIATCHVNDLSNLRAASYSITVDGVTDDPYVIVDNQGRGDQIPGAKRPKKPAASGKP